MHHMVRYKWVGIYLAHFGYLGTYGTVCKRCRHLVVVILWPSEKILVMIVVIGLDANLVVATAIVAVAVLKVPSKLLDP